MLGGRLEVVSRKRKGVALGVWGEAGIGKSHAVQELLVTTACRSVTVHATSPLETLARSLPTSDKQPSWAKQTLARLARRDPVEAAGARDALAATLAAAAPFVLHLEDVHEADEARLEFIRGLARSVQRSKGVGLIVTSRVEPPEPFLSIRLEPLSEEAAADLVQKEMAAPLPRESLAWIYRKAQGNPLFTREYLRFVTQQGYLWNDGKSWHWRKPEHDNMPGTVEALIEHLVDGVQAGSLQRYVLESKALLSHDVSADVWQKVARVDPEDLRTELEGLSRRGLFRGDDFAHPLFREVTLKKMAPDRRRDLSRRAINALVTVPTQAAMFVDEARLAPDVALDLLKSAAQQAQRTNKVQAAGFLAQAVDHAVGAEKSRLALEAARTLASADRLEAMRLLQAAHEADPGDVEITYLLASLHADLGRSKEVEELLELLPHDEKTQLNWFKRLIGFRFSLHDYRSVLEIFEQQPRLRNDLEPALAYHIGFSQVIAGNYEDAEAIARRALAGADISNVPPIARAQLLSVCGLARHYQGDNVGAEPLFDEAVAAARASGVLDYLAATLHNRATLYESTNREAAMLADVEEALRLYAEVGASRYHASTRVLQARILHEMGRYEEAEEGFQQSRDMLARADQSDFLVTCEAQLSGLYLDWQLSYAVPLAQKHAQLALQIARPIGGRKLCLALYHASLVESRQGHAARGLELAQECLALAAQFQAEPSYQALFAKGIALEGLGNTEEALAHYQEAEKLASGSDWQVYGEKIGLEIDRLMDDVESARERMQRFEERGLMNGVNLAKRYFPALADAPVPLQRVDENRPRLEVLGAMQLSHTRQTAPMRGRKRQAFLARLLESRIAARNEVGRLELLDSVYPDNDEAKALNSLKQLVHALRLEWGESTILTTAAGYALGAVESDAELFFATGDTALWRGGYLAGLESPAHETVAESLYELLYHRATDLLQTEPKEVARVARFLLEYDPYNTDFLALNVQALRETGDHGTLVRLYDSARKRFEEVGEALPDHWTSFLDQHTSS